MRLRLLCALAVALLAVAGADPRDSKKGKTLTRDREAGTRGGGRRRPCSGCFSVLSEESTSMAWSTGDVDEGPAGRRERTRRESERPAQVARGRGHVPQLGQEAPGAHAAWAGEAPVTQRGPTRGRSRGSRRPLTAPRGPAAPHQP
ncbi:uncharacterized protein [Anser cygnoides]|uniref:uncharacterized protein isoform X4 n=1 Tax=Anser cygnoides TaxID=8845 RepID=UPI0020097B7E|nr:uncharacterized protein LOC125180909 isoform X3 [Anser cygnoides]